MACYWCGLNVDHLRLADSTKILSILSSLWGIFPVSQYCLRAVSFHWNILMELRLIDVHTSHPLRPVAQRSVQERPMNQKSCSGTYCLNNSSPIVTATWSERVIRPQNDLWRTFLTLHSLISKPCCIFQKISFLCQLEDDHRENFAAIFWCYPSQKFSKQWYWPWRRNTQQWSNPPAIRQAYMTKQLIMCNLCSLTVCKKCSQELRWTFIILSVQF